MTSQSQPRQVPIPLHSASSSTREGRAFLRSRIALFGGWVFLISGGFYAFGAVMRRLIGDIELDVAGTSPLNPNSFHLIGTLVAGAVWMIARKTSLSSAGLWWLDGVGTFLMCASFAAMAGTFSLVHTLLIEDPRHALFIGVLACSYVLISRAISVPCTPVRTVLVSTAAVSPMVATAWLTLRQAEPFARMSGTIDITSWSVAAVAMAGISSRVIFGLRAEVARIRRLGQYTLESKIGEGGMGIVYRASHALLRRPTAIKILPPERAGEENIRRFEREVQLTATLSHPSTVVIFDYGRTPEGVFYYAMEYLDGLDLARLVDYGGPQPAERVIHVLYQVAGALAEAHGVGLIHRDIKPANIILGERGGMPDVAKVVDFGLVKHSVPESAETGLDVTAANVIVGTPLYMAPETISAAGIDARSDLYALGAVGYFMLTGQPVFEGRTVVEVCGHHLHTTPIPPSVRMGRPIPADFEGLILRCLEKSPDDRYPDALALQDALLRCAEKNPWPRSEALSWWSDFKALQSEPSSQRPAAASQIPATIEIADPFSRP